MISFNDAYVSSVLTTGHPKTVLNNIISIVNGILDKYEFSKFTIGISCGGSKTNPKSSKNLRGRWNSKYKTKQYTHIIPIYVCSIAKRGERGLGNHKIIEVDLINYFRSYTPNKIENIRTDKDGTRTKKQKYGYVYIAGRRERVNIILETVPHKVQPQISSPTTHASTYIPHNNTVNRNYSSNDDNIISDCFGNCGNEQYLILGCICCFLPFIQPFGCLIAIFLWLYYCIIKT